MTDLLPRIVAAHPRAAAWTASLGIGLLAIAVPYLASASVTLGILAIVVGLTRNFGRDRARPGIGPLLLVVVPAALGAALLVAAPPELAPVRALGFAIALAPLAFLGVPTLPRGWGTPRGAP